MTRANKLEQERSGSHCCPVARSTAFGFPRRPDRRQPVSLAALNERSREIFKSIVESYLATGELVGSRNLSRIPDLAVARLDPQRDVGS